MFKLKNLGFTLAEALITMMVVGLIAVLIIPAFTNSINDETLKKQKEVFSKKFQEGLSQMRVDDKLAESYSTTQDFVNQMQKYFKITQVCDNNNLDNCFDKTFYARAYYKGELTASKDFVSANLRTTKDLNEKSSFDTDVIGLRLSDGTQMLITYNPDCTGVEAGDTQGSTTSCFSYVTDVNGNKGPNLYGKDVISNVALIHNFGLSFEIGEVFSPTLEKTCEEIKAMGIKSNGQEIQSCENYNNNNTWANAVYKCAKEGKRLPTPEELQELASAIYGQSISLSGTIRNLSVENQALHEALGSYGEVHLWGTENKSGNSGCYKRYFGLGIFEGSDFYTSAGYDMCHRASGSSVVGSARGGYKAFCVDN